MKIITLPLCVLAFVLVVVVGVAPSAAQTTAIAAATPTLTAQIAPLASLANSAEPAAAGSDSDMAVAEPQRQPPGGTSNSGPMTVVPVHNSFVVQPSVRFGRLNHRDATFIGGNAGVLVDNRLFFGGGGQWLASNDPGFRMRYVGFGAGWRAIGHGSVDVNVSSLVGGGRADSTYPAYYGPHGGYGYYYYEDSIFVFEPQLDLVLRLARNAWITAGGSYRVVTGSHGSDLSGATGTVSITFGSR